MKEGIFAYSLRNGSNFLILIYIYIYHLFILRIIWHFGIFSYLVSCFHPGLCACGCLSLIEEACFWPSSSSFTSFCLAKHGPIWRLQNTQNTSSTSFNSIKLNFRFISSILKIFIRSNPTCPSKDLDFGSERHCSFSSKLSIIGAILSSSYTFILTQQYYLCTFSCNFFIYLMVQFAGFIFTSITAYCYYGSPLSLWNRLLKCYFDG